ncbi:MAG TPA: HU family DNA-binding protein [Patescibacteria group bacterium]|nr:HU family DNA-binding protein [Patescibacteria group bacterium]
MTKSQMIALLSEKTSMSKKDVTSFIDTLVGVIYDETKEAGVCTLPGLGKLVKKTRNARVGRNPATGEQIQIPAKTVCKFRLSKAAKDAILS